jgi:GNAT superfamily N-acetyltransferase
LPGPDPARGAIRVRSATAADAGAIAALIADGALGPTDDRPDDPAPYVDALAEIAERPGGDVLVAEVDGDVVGVCQLLVFRHLQHRGGRCAEIESMHVREDRRSAGIGGRLLEAAVEAARSAGCYRIQLTSNTARSDAHRFYERHGFAASHVGFKRLLAPAG